MKRWLVGLVNFHSQEDTDKCIDSLLRAATGPLRVLVIDNSSDYEPTKGHSPYVEVQVPGRNAGYAGAVNYMLRVARETRPDYLWILNNDCLVEPGVFSAYEAVDAPTAGDVLTSVVLNGDKDQIWYGGGSRSALGSPSHDKYGVLWENHQTMELIDTEWASGANIVLPLRTVERAEDWDEHLFLYCEELEWQMRMDLKVQLLEAALVRHFAGSASGGPAGRIERVFTARNRLIIALRQKGANRLLHLAGILLDFYAKPLWKGQTTFLRYHFLGMTWMRVGGPEIVNRLRSVA